MIYPVSDDVVYADTDVAEDQQVLFPQLGAFSQVYIIVLEVQHSLYHNSRFTFTVIS